MESSLQTFLLHPAMVHFPIAFLLLGLAVFAVAIARDSAMLDRGASVLLVLGAVAAWAAVGLGGLAERTAPHLPAAWETVETHRGLGYRTAIAFTVLALVRIAVLRRRLRLAQLVLWIVAAALLVATAYQGGELVYHFGMGVERSE